MTLLLALCALGLAQQPEPAAEESERAKVDTSFSDDFEIRYWQDDRRLPDPDDRAVFNYLEQVNRLNAAASSGDLSLELQVDQVALFANQYFLDDELRTERIFLEDAMFAPLTREDASGGQLNRFGYVTLEKIRARIEKDSYTLAFGDTYAAFGRGIALNLNRNVDIDIDTSVQGFKGVFRPGAWDVTVVAGQLNRQQVFQDNPNIELKGDRRHAVAGLRIERFGLGPANVGIHGAAYDFVDTFGWFDEPIQLADEDPADGTSRGIEELGTPVDAVVGGATLELNGVGGIDWFVEGDVFGFPTDTLPSQVQTVAGERYHEFGTAYRPEDIGYATYGSASFYPGKTTWLVEFKRYYQTERVNSLLADDQYEVATAPTLEYDQAINEDTASALNSSDIIGGRVRVDWAAKPGRLVPYVALGVFRDDNLSTVHFNAVPETIIQPVLGVEALGEHSSVIANAAYRQDIRDADEGIANCTDANRRFCDPGSDNQLWIDWAWRFPLGGDFHGELQGNFEIWHWGVNEFQQEDYIEASNGFTVQKGSDLAVTLYNDYTSNGLVLVDSVGNIPVEIDGTQPLFAAGEVMVKPSSAVTMKAFYGAYKAGIRCSGGQCRQLPGFRGGRFTFQGTF